MCHDGTFHRYSKVTGMTEELFLWKGKVAQFGEPSFKVFVKFWRVGIVLQFSLTHDDLGTRRRTLELNGLLQLSSDSWSGPLKSVQVLTVLQGGHKIRREERSEQRQEAGKLAGKFALKDVSGK